MDDLGPATEARFAQAFADRAIVTARTAAQLIGVDIKTLHGLTAKRALRYVLRGNLPAFTERDLRAYLTDPQPVAEPDPKRPTRRTLRRTKLVNFADHHPPTRRT
jgi:hypothetical protein